MKRQGSIIAVEMALASLTWPAPFVESCSKLRLFVCAEIFFSAEVRHSESMPLWVRPRPSRQMISERYNHRMLASKRTTHCVAEDTKTDGLSKYQST